MTIEHWWKHAVLYGLSVNGGRDQRPAEVLRGLAERMDDLLALGVDAVLLRDLAAMRVGPTDAAADSAEEQQKLEAFDDVVQQASRRRLRVLVELRSSSSADLTAKTRFWLNRGVAGFSLAAADAPTELKQVDAVAAIRAVLNGYAGERIVVGLPSTTATSEQVPSDLAETPVPDAAVSTHHRRHRTQSMPVSAGRVDRSASSSAEPEMMLILAPRPTSEVAAARASLQTVNTRIHSMRTTPLLSLSDTVDQQGGDHEPNTDPVLGRAEAAILLGFGVPALVDGRALTLPASPSETGVANPETTVSPQTSHKTIDTAPAKQVTERSAAELVQKRSLYEWYRRMNSLARGNPTLRSGGAIVLDHDRDKALVWMRTSKGAGPVVFLACNLSDQPVTLSLLEDVQRLHLRGSFLRTILRSDEGMGAMSLRAVALAPYGVYVGELAR